MSYDDEIDFYRISDSKMFYASDVSYKPGSIVIYVHESMHVNHINVKLCTFVSILIKWHLT